MKDLLSFHFDQGQLDERFRQLDQAKTEKKEASFKMVTWNGVRIREDGIDQPWYRRLLTHRNSQR
ncbi:hypothetical protein PAE9249_01679 [Paenibacillus sp. CECT 9249]|uniref:hypothetical protein n=1 Tax=Paenibacillus sp. CECT 9249 TaxID=2845385 RepID=UPI001E647B60|nr:hypothetical protein [Paenibacillus sp. CECT 9249]CAH0119180.1 hypothetical protein PAE9249_01679 [Paenibacillus sp. CECT 9249]